MRPTVSSSHAFPLATGHEFSKRILVPFAFQARFSRLAFEFSSKMEMVSCYGYERHNSKRFVSARGKMPRSGAIVRRLLPLSRSFLLNSNRQIPESKPLVSRSKQSMGHRSNRQIFREWQFSFQPQA